MSILPRLAKPRLIYLEIMISKLFMVCDRIRSSLTRAGSVFASSAALVHPSFDLEPNIFGDPARFS